MEPCIIDTHAHYDDEAFDGDREALLDTVFASGIGRIVNVCASMKSLDAVPELIRGREGLYGAVGIHPDDAPFVSEEVLERIRLISREPKMVAIGEIGLDYYWHKEEAEHDLQKKVFASQMELAREEGLPFMIHSRDAARDTLEMVKEFCRGGRIRGGIIHCFSYSWEIAREYLNLGLTLGIGGVVTFSNAKKLAEVVEKAPLSQLVLETDCPYLAPVPFRGKRNQSGHLPLVADKIAEIKGVTREEVIETTFGNAMKLLWPEERS